jgi:antitoxin (DNA-binding transcriptional repressor) of toxin-antitoxin stability system
MTIHVSIKDAKNRLSQLVRQFEDGERVVITRNGQPVFEMAQPRKGGIDFEALARWKKARGIEQVVTYIPPDFDDPLPEDFLITPITYPDEKA